MWERITKLAMDAGIIRRAPQQVRTVAEHVVINSKADAVQLAEALIQYIGTRPDRGDHINTLSDKGLMASADVSGTKFCETGIPVDAIVIALIVVMNAVLGFLSLLKVSYCAAWHLVAQNCAKLSAVSLVTFDHPPEGCQDPFAPWASAPTGDVQSLAVK
jgi:hypothetical protein